MSATLKGLADSLDPASPTLWHDAVAAAKVPTDLDLSLWSETPNWPTSPIAEDGTIKTETVRRRAVWAFAKVAAGKKVEVNFDSQHDGMSAFGTVRQAIGDLVGSFHIGTIDGPAGDAIGVSSNVVHIIPVDTVASMEIVG